MLPKTWIALTVLCLIKSSVKCTRLTAVDVEIGSPQYLTVSAVVSNPKSNGDAEIQCWRFRERFHEYPTVGKALQLGNTANMTYVVLPPRSQEGLHHPPHNMFFILLSGVAHVTLPGRSGELWIVAEVNPLIIATDVDGPGHYTAYPSETESVALQVPFAEGRIPEHDILFYEASQAPIIGIIELYRTGLSIDKATFVHNPTQSSSILRYTTAERASISKGTRLEDVQNMTTSLVTNLSQIEPIPRHQMEDIEEQLTYWRPAFTNYLYHIRVSIGFAIPQVHLRAKIVETHLASPLHSNLRYKEVRQHHWVLTTYNYDTVR